MPLQTSLLMLRGIYLSSIPGIFELFGYRVIGSPRRVAHWDQALAAIRSPQPGKPRTVVQKAACCFNGWTVILDAQMTMMEENEACLEVSRRLKTRLFGMLCESTSQTCAYVFYNGDLKRSLWVAEGSVFTDVGERQPEEPDINPAYLTERHVLEILARLGVEYPQLTAVSDYHIYELDKSDRFITLRKKTAPLSSGPKSSDQPWWRFW